MGGTEATVCRIAGLLGADINMEWEDGYDIAVFLRDPTSVEGIEGPKVLWMHDYHVAADVTDEIRAMVGDTPMVGVSDFHAANLKEHFGGDVRRIYNPVVATRTHPYRNRKKIIYTSSPSKGFMKTLDVFGNLLRRDRSLRLYWANPGYSKGPRVHTKYVLPLDSLPQPQVLKHVESAALLLQCNEDFPETFGLVYGEARALGTPVLTGDLGAAREVAGDESVMPLDATNSEWCDRIQAILEDPPVVDADPRFDLDTVAQEWRDFLEQTISCPTRAETQATNLRT